AEDKIDEAIELRTSFGWKFLTKTPFSLTMKREPSETNKQLAKLEKQYDSLSKQSPFSFIPWTMLLIIFLVLTCAYANKYSFGFIFIIGLVISSLIDFIVLATFLVTLPYRKKLKDRILLQASEYNGKVKTVPFAVNLKTGTQNSYQIKKAVYSKELKID
nr:hypothetical protein [Gammaproteobacteria bacterium]